jgi:hypothetical protein
VYQTHLIGSWKGPRVVANTKSSHICHFKIHSVISEVQHMDRWTGGQANVTYSRIVSVFHDAHFVENA